MRRIVEYKIVTSEQLSNEFGLPSIESQVQELIVEGWEPFGSLHHQLDTFAQPMVKYVSSVAISVSDYERMKDAGEAL